MIIIKLDFCWEVNFPDFTWQLEMFDPLKKTTTITGTCTMNSKNTDKNQEQDWKFSILLFILLGKILYHFTYFGKSQTYMFLLNREKFGVCIICFYEEGFCCYICSRQNPNSFLTSNKNVLISAFFFKAILWICHQNWLYYNAIRIYHGKKKNCVSLQVKTSFFAVPMVF